MWDFQRIFLLLKQNKGFFNTFLWAYGISAIKSTCSHFVVHLLLSRLGKQFEFSLKWNCEWLLSNKETHFLVTLEHFFIFLDSNLGSMLKQLTWHSSVRGKFYSPSFVLYLRELQYVKKLCCINLWTRQTNSAENMLLETRGKEICNISTLKSREMIRNLPTAELSIT